MGDGRSLVTPPVFVQYDGRGVIAFDDLDDSVFGISDKYAHRITAAWDGEGQRLAVDHRGGPFLTITPTGTSEREYLRRLLIDLQQPTLVATDLSTMPWEDLVSYSYQRLRLRTRAELTADGAAGCYGCSWPFG